MSAESLPITSPRFAAALSTLPPSSLHAKLSELSNSIAHLHRSNAELEAYIQESKEERDGDKECYEAIQENKDVVRKMEERVELVKREIVEVRGLPLRVEGEGGSGGARVNGAGGGDGNGTAEGGRNGEGEGGDEGEEGVYL